MNTDTNINGLRLGINEVRGLVKEHLDSFNYFVTTGIKKIVAANSTITSQINPINVYLRYEDVRIGLPSESNVVIGRLPIMLRSCRCILYEEDEVELANL
nr:hypothetical protein [Tanacetum cinerariifolium]